MFDYENYCDLICPLSVGDLLYVGPCTNRKLRNMAIFAIGDLARVDLRYTRPMLGKMADILNGLDTTPVAHIGDTSPVNSSGKRCIAPRDLSYDGEAKILSLLSGMRLRELGMQAKTVCIHLRDNEL